MPDFGQLGKNVCKFVTPEEAGMGNIQQLSNKQLEGIARALNGHQDKVAEQLKARIKQLEREIKNKK